MIAKGRIGVLRAGVSSGGPRTGARVEVLDPLGHRNVLRLLLLGSADASSSATASPSLSSAAGASSSAWSSAPFVAGFLRRRPPRGPAACASSSAVRRPPRSRRPARPRAPPGPPAQALFLLRRPPPPRPRRRGPRAGMDRGLGPCAVCPLASSARSAAAPAVAGFFLRPRPPRVPRRVRFFGAAPAAGLVGRLIGDRHDLVLLGLELLLVLLLGLRLGRSLRRGRRSRLLAARRPSRLLGLASNVIPPSADSASAGTANAMPSSTRPIVTETFFPTSFAASATTTS